MRVIDYTRSINGYELTFDYDPVVIGVIKTRVDYNMRRFDRATKAWTIQRRADFEKVCDVLRAKGYTIRHERGDEKDHTPESWVPANRRSDYVDPLARRSNRAAEARKKREAGDK